MNKNILLKQTYNIKVSKDAKIYFRMVNNMEIKRNLYLNKLISLKHNGLIRL